MGISQYMNTVMKNNRLMKGERKSMFDRQRISTIGVQGEIVDHTQLKSHAFAQFQKELFLKLKNERKQRILRNMLVFVITILIVIGFLWIWSQLDRSMFEPGTLDLFS